MGDEADKATRKDMEQHNETSRRIQSRARLEFDQIIAQHTISNNDSRRGSLESVQESEDEPAPQQVSEDLLADMKKRREQTKKIKARAHADFEKVIQEETAKQQLRDMEAHAEKSRKIQKRAQEQFEAIVQEETDKAQLRDMEDHVQKFRKTKHRARAEFDQIVAEHTKKLESEVFDLEKELKSMEAKRQQNKKTKEKAKEIEDVVKNHQIKEKKTEE